MTDAVAEKLSSPEVSLCIWWSSVDFTHFPVNWSEVLTIARNDVQLGDPMRYSFGI